MEKLILIVDDAKFARVITKKHYKMADMTIL